MRRGEMREEKWRSMIETMRKDDENRHRDGNGDVAIGLNPCCSSTYLFGSACLRMSMLYCATRSRERKGKKERERIKTRPTAENVHGE